MVLLALLLAAPSDVLPLREEPQVRDLCSALRDVGESFEGDPAEVAAARREAQLKRDQAAQAIYGVEVPSKGFSFGRFRPDEDLLELDGDRPLRAVNNELSLDLDGTDDVAFHARPEQVSQWSRAQKAGTLKLAVTFRPSGDRCAGSAAARAWRIAGHSISWQLLDGDKVVAAADEGGEPVGLPAGRRSIAVEKISLDEADEADGARVRFAGVQPALDKCAASARRLGTLVVAFAVQGGHVREPQVILDALRDEAVSGCVARALSGASLTGAGGKSGRGTATLALQ
jgi:hypothetical protein